MMFRIRTYQSIVGLDKGKPVNFEWLYYCEPSRLHEMADLVNFVFDYEKAKQVQKCLIDHYTEISQPGSKFDFIQIEARKDDDWVDGDHYFSVIELGAI